MSSVDNYDIVHIYADIGRGIFQKYFTPTAYIKFDKDHKLQKIIQELFDGKDNIVSLLKEKATDLERKINKENALNVLQGKSRVDFEDYIKGELGENSEDYKLFQILLDRMEQHENKEKERVFSIIDKGEDLSEDDYLFVFELFEYDRCSSQEFRKLYKFIRNTQFLEDIIISRIPNMRNKRYQKGFALLVKDKGSEGARERVQEYL